LIKNGESGLRQTRCYEKAAGIYECEADDIES